MFTLFKSYLWEQRKLGEIFSTVTDYVANGSFKDLKENVKTYNTPNYAYMIRLIDASNGWKGPWLYTDKNGYSFLKKSALRDNDILLSNVGAGVGKTFLAPKLDKPMTLAPNCILLRSSCFNGKYTYYLINTFTNKNKILSMVGVSAQPKINKSDFKKISVPIAPQKQEQSKIEKILSAVDLVLTLQQKKLEQMSQLKKFILNNLFSYRELPKVRFQKFTYPWEQRKLGEITDITMGQAPNSNSYTTNPKDMILVQGNADLSDGKVVPRIWTTSITKEAPKGDIILTVRAPVGEVAISDYKVVLGRGVAAIKGDLFIYYWLKFMQQNHAWDKFSTGSTFESINSSDIQNIACGYPVKSEQTLISSLLSKIYKSIHLQKQKIVYLKSLKKFLLQKLFI